MDFENPKNGNTHNTEGGTHDRRRNPQRRAARLPAQLGQQQNPQNSARRQSATAAQVAQNPEPKAAHSRSAHTEDPQAAVNMRTAANNRAAADERMPVNANPREQLRKLEHDGSPQQQPRAELVRRGSARAESAKPVQAPLPREIQYEVPVIDPEVLRRTATERQSGEHSGAQTRVFSTSDVAAAKVSASKPAKPLPKHAAGSAAGGKVRVGYKRADDFLPEKLVVTRDNRVEVSSVDTSGKDQNLDKIDNLDFEENEPARRGSALSSLLKAIIYIVFVLTVSGFLSYFIIAVGNDVFAFIKPDQQITVKVPEFATVDNIADILEQNGVIKYPFVFKLYAFLRKDNGAYVAGEYIVSPSMSYDELSATFKGPVQEREQISITIPEGYTVDQIIDLFVNEYGMGTREGFINAIENADFSGYWFIDELQVKNGRKYRLEGYLYPDTYYFFTDWNEEQILRKFLNNFSSKFDESYKERCKELGMTVDELITLASMIEAEGKFTYEFGAISAVFHNRMNNPSVTGGKLESDATIQYVLTERHEELTVDDLALDSPYNTYKYSGLPPGPITNPTLNAIHSAMYPDDVGYYYFVARPNGQNLFAVTYQEHQANKQQVAQEKAAMKSQQ